MTVRRRSTVAVVFATALLAAASAARACPFCASTGSSSDAGYIVATVILVALPVALLGGFVHWLRRLERANSIPPPDEATK